MKGPRRSIHLSGVSGKGRESGPARRWLAAAALNLVLALTASAQSELATVSGTVADPPTRRAFPSREPKSWSPTTPPVSRYRSSPTRAEDTSRRA
jgi:hypothetical protein